MNRYDIALGVKPEIIEKPVIEKPAAVSLTSYEVTLDTIQRNELDNIERLIAYNRTSSWIRDARNNHPPSMFRKLFATMRIGLPRRMGKTTIACVFYQAHPNTIIVAHSSDMQRDIRRRLLTLNLDHDPRVYNGKSPHSLRGIGADFVIVDEVDCISEEALEILYNISAEYVILLGGVR